VPLAHDQPSERKIAINDTKIESRLIKTKKIFTRLLKINCWSVLPARAAEVPRGQSIRHH